VKYNQFLYPFLKQLTYWSDYSPKMQYLCKGKTDFDESWPSRHRLPVTFRKFENTRWRRIQDGGGRHVEKSENLNIFATV